MSDVWTKYIGQCENIFWHTGGWHNVQLLIKSILPVIITFLMALRVVCHYAVFGSGGWKKPSQT